MAEKYLVEGYEFDTLEEADEAKKELEAVQYLSDKVRESSPETARKIYQRVVEQNMFHTPVGKDFVKTLGDYLEQNHVPEAEVQSGEPQNEEVQSGEAQSEEVQSEEAQDGETQNEETAPPPDSKAAEKRRKALEGELKRTKDRLVTSLIFNVIMAIAIAVMIYIASTSSNVNILNYETALQDRYSSWAQELKDRESRLREREAAVKAREIELNLGTETQN